MGVSSPARYIRTLSDEFERRSARDRLADDLDALSADFLANRDQWESLTIDAYLAAAAAWVRDSDGAFVNLRKTPPPAVAYEFVGSVLLAASRYE